MFTPLNLDSPSWDYHIIRRGTNVIRDVQSVRENVRVNEKEYVLLLSIEDETKSKVDPEFTDLLT